MGNLHIKQHSKEATVNFLKENNLLLIIRGHEAQLNGYKMCAWSDDSKFPSIITMFSAPNYCDAYKNKGAVIKIFVLYFY